MIPNKNLLGIGVKFDLPTKPGHYFRLDHFARPCKPGEQSRWTDLDVHYTEAYPNNATHVHGWNSYAAFLTIERLLAEGRILYDAEYIEHARYVDVSGHHNKQGELYMPSQPWGLHIYYHDLPASNGGPNVSLSSKSKAKAVRDLPIHVGNRPKTTGIVFRRSDGEIVARLQV